MLYFLTLYFLIINVLYVFHAQDIVLFNQSLAKFVRERKKKGGIAVIQGPDSVFVLTFALVYSLSEFLFLFYCILLMFQDELWVQSCFLLFLLALYNYGVKARVFGATLTLRNRQTIPRSWFVCFMYGLINFVLYQILQSL